VARAATRDGVARMPTPEERTTVPA
jgi:hypothetical protein